VNFISGNGQGDRKHSASTFLLVTCPDGASHRLDETACDRKTQSGASLNVISFTHTIERIEHMLQIVMRNPWASIRDFQRYVGCIRVSFNRNGRILRSVFCGVVEQIE